MGKLRIDDIDLDSWDDMDFEDEQRIGRPSTFGKMRINDADGRKKGQDKRAKRRDVRGRKEAELAN